MNPLRQAVVDQAKAWLGCHESDGSHRVIIDLYNKYKRPGDYTMRYVDPWCAAFSSAVGMAVCVANALPCKPFELIPSSAACDPKIQQYEARGAWVEDDAYLPTPGDEIFYDWEDSGSGDDMGSSDHVGIVVAVDGNTITVIEGNKSDSVGYRKLQRNGRYIRGFGIPAYSTYSGSVPADGQGVIVIDPAEDTNVPTKPVTGTNVGGKVSGLPMLRRGMTGEVVRAAQFLLNGRGASCGRYGADGDFGPATNAAVLAFQRRSGLEADGIIGPATWAALLGL